MKTETKKRTERMSGEDRREAILEAAVAEFALKGLHGTSTETIAQRVGVSQPYLFHYFGTKKDLFLAAVSRGFDRVEIAFRQAAREHPDHPLDAMGEIYKGLLQHREELLLQMHAYAACSDPDVRELVRTRYSTLYRFASQVGEAAGATEDDVRSFFACGMLLNVAATMDLLSIASQDWADDLLGVFSD